MDGTFTSVEYSKYAQRLAMDKPNQEMYPLDKFMAQVYLGVS